MIKLILLTRKAKMTNCSNTHCSKDGKDVERWQLTDSLGYPCGLVCTDCHDQQKSKYKSVIFDDPHDYRQHMAECGENIDSDY